MQEKYLVINAGSSSLKFSLFDAETEKELVNGYVEKIGNPDSFYTLKFNEQKIKKETEIKNHVKAIDCMLTELIDNVFVTNINEIVGVGHRVLHGGEFYGNSVVIDEEVLENIDMLTKLGPLHHPGELSGIRSIEACIPGVTQVAVFDTAFHQTMPMKNYLYPVPYDWYEQSGVRKYGFHGTSHKYITGKMKELLQKDNPNLIICHIGSGASITAVKDGESYDTTMGLTPVDGLMMGTRSGSIDPSILEYICKENNISISEATELLNKKSGLLGIAGKNDLRDVQELAASGDERAQLAIEMYKKSIIDNIAKFYFELQGNIDSIIFTAGAGENSSELREQIIEEIAPTIGIELNKEENNDIAGFKKKTSGLITTATSSIPVYVIPTNEELMIFKDTKKLVEKEKNRGKAYYIA